MRTPSQIVIQSDGTILAATGRLPADVVDLRLEDCAGLPAVVRDAGASLLPGLRHSTDRIASAIAEVDGEPVHVVAIAGLVLRRAPTDVCALIDSKLSVLRSQVESAGIALITEVGAEVPRTANVDAERVAWAVTTLVGNSLRYVTVPSRRFGGTAIIVRTDFDAPASLLTITVRDNGPGIPADTVKRLFARDGINVRGPGLALLLIRDIVAAHGGRVDLTSSTDVGRHGTSIQLGFPI